MTEIKNISYLSPLMGDIPRNLSYPLVNEDNFTLLKTGKTGLLQGPRRVLRLCVFALVIPAVLITIPLYVRLVLYPPGHLPMMPTDQRLLHGQVSGIWCQAQSTHMNGSFNAFMSHGFPGLERDRRRHVMLHSMKMRDDVKEYWGFHLLKGSTITLSSCARWDGGQLMILRGIENLRRCAWIGEKDSYEDMEEDDDISSEERHKIQENFLKESLGSKPSGNEEPQLPLDATKHSEERRQNLAQLLRKVIKMSKDKKEILKILHSEGKDNFHISPEQSDHLDLDRGNNTDDKSLPENRVYTNESFPSDVGNGNKTKEQTASPVDAEVKSDGLRITDQPVKEAVSKRLKQETRREKRKRLQESRRNKKKGGGGRRRFENLTEEDLLQGKGEGGTSRLKRSTDYDDDDGAFEELDTDDVVDILQDPTKKKKNAVNMSPVENTVGGQIFFPEGLKFERGKFNQTTMNDMSREEQVSSYSSSEEALASCEGVILTLPLVSYRKCHFHTMSLNKIIYDIPITGTYYFVFSSDNEIYVNDLFFNLTMDRVVYNINSTEQMCSNATDCSLPLSFWSDEQTVVEVPQESQWDNSYILDTKCEPRVYVYLTLLLLVPLFIMCCAFH